MQLTLAQVIPGETDDIGRFQKLERLVEAKDGVTDLHLRRDAGRLEVCVHYDENKITFDEVVALVRATGELVSKRYLQKTWFVRGMDSAQCGYMIEYALGRVKGVLSANVAYAAERLVIEYDKQEVSLGDIEKRVRALGFELEEPEKGHACSHHSHGGGLAPSWELPLSIASGVCLAIGWALDGFHLGPGWLPKVFFVLSLLGGGIYALRNAFNSVRQLRFDIETLMVLAAVGAWALGAWFEGALLLFLFSVGHALEHRALDRARRAIEALGRLRPEVARVKRGTEVVEVPVRQVQRGDVIVVRAGDLVPLDGTVREGKSSLDQAAITGESVPVPKGPGDHVYAGTVNTDAVLEIQVTKLSSESAIARVIDMVSEAEAQKSPTQRFTQRLERRFVPVILALAPTLAVVLVASGHSIKEALLRATSLLVAASPCALAISTPSAVLSAVARAARGGVLMKGGAHLEALGKITAIAFDKTGTLTIGKPKLVTVSPAEGVTEAQLLATAAGTEVLSSHPLAKAIVEGARERGVSFQPAVDCKTVHGKGLKSTVDGKTVFIGNTALFVDEKIEIPSAIAKDAQRLEEAGQTTMIVRHGTQFLGVIGVADTLRKEAAATLKRLHALGVRKTVMLSGDNIRVAKAIGKQVGIDEPRAPLMPEGKVLALKELAKEEGGVAMVGDGVNDAPALAAASVGVAMGGAGSDVALETADVVLMSDDLQRLPFAVGLARAATATVKQNLVISLGVSALLILATIFGWVQIAHAVVLHEGSTLLVVANGLRLLTWDELPVREPAPSTESRLLEQGAHRERSGSERSLERVGESTER